MSNGPVRGLFNQVITTAPTSTSIYEHLQSIIEAETKRLDEVWEMNRLVVKLELEELEENRSHQENAPIKKTAQKRKWRQTWKLDSAYIDLGVKKAKKIKADNLMVHILVAFEWQMNEWIDNPLVHLEKSLCWLIYWWNQRDDG